MEINKINMIKLSKSNPKFSNCLTNIPDYKIPRLYYLEIKNVI